MRDPTLRSLTYVSRAIEVMDDGVVAALALEAARLNALDGITGLLVFNGRRFLQTIEGVRDAIDDLLVRLRRDPRHCDLIVCAERPIATRSFGSWDMHLVMLADGDMRPMQARAWAHVAEFDRDRLFSAD